MAVVHEFQYHKPTSLKETLQLLAKQGEKSRLLAGGTDLAVYIKEGLEYPESVIDIKRVPELSKFEVTKDHVYIGANVTFSDILENQKIKNNWQLLWESARSVASVGIRNRATLVGNICSAIPSMDSAPALLCYEAKVHLRNAKGTRQVAIDKWWTAPRKTVRKADEIVLGVSLGKPSDKHAGCYIKLGRYGGEDLAQAGLGLLVTAKHEYRIAWCAVGPIPIRAKKTEKLLDGKALTPALISKAMDLVLSEITPITDIRSSREYRNHICRIMLQRGLEVCNDRLKSKKVDTSRILGG